MANATFEHGQLSESPDYGQPLYQDSPSNLPVDVHIAGSGTDVADEVYLWACNRGTDDFIMVVSVEHSGAGVNVVNRVLVKADLRAELILPGLRVADSGEITVKSETSGDSFTVWGHINRITNDPSA